MSTNLTPAGWNHLYSGKVRDLFEPASPSTDVAGAGDAMLLVASDRVSAYDYVLSPGIPGKGEVLTRLSLWWFDQLNVPNHLVASHAPGGAGLAALPPEVADRAMLVKKLDMFPVEAVVRGYLTGSGWKEYQQNGTVCEIPLPAGLQNGDKLPEPIYTPAWKAPLGEHDENISFDRTVELIGEEDAVAVRDLALAIYTTAAQTAESRGLILADTKFEFGRDPDSGDIALADEVLTPDSSRYWDAESWATEQIPDARMASFDKQIVRNWLTENWNMSGTPPELPADVIERTANRYRELLERMTGA
ncbi:phosphoribosylaminoimidazolesuccinocarboxamide synthase [Microbacterium sp. MPKO10]|uniref:phosphoribosylaminoimidazolesuccinocarboxamide synthase n=1 Tax=Microbacterium sp. MPKO10 TaxID=2989818 RepID=UPI002236144D|nr:phosphoribosylaminoimidazolesuccinocarboxamide synthase [Microbacterium sp. MPKO10]MCW4458945.1 phosphoribosylaminoimidazolesuccinocarboxamide synthase [Microbacterium sp. MPKO10]